MICEFCGIDIKRKDNLQRHIREQHSEVRTVYSCTYCQRPFIRSTALKRHLVKCHRMDDPKEEVRGAKRKIMTEDQLTEAKKPVYISTLYEDLTPERSPQHLSAELDYEPVSSDEEEIEKMCGDDWPSVNSDIINELMQNAETDSIGQLAEDLLDANPSLAPCSMRDLNSARDDQNFQDAVPGPSGIMEDHVCDATYSGLMGRYDFHEPEQKPDIHKQCKSEEVIVINDDDSDESPGEVEGDSYSEPDSTTITSCVMLKMVKRTTYYRRGTKETVRSTEISHSENVDPTTLNIAAIATEIMDEINAHSRNRNVKIVEMDSDCDNE